MPDMPTLYACNVCGTVGIKPPPNAKDGWASFHPKWPSCRMYETVHHAGGGNLCRGTMQPLTATAPTEAIAKPLTLPRHAIENVRVMRQHYEIEGERLRNLAARLKNNGHPSDEADVGLNARTHEILVADWRALEEFLAQFAPPLTSQVETVTDGRFGPNYTLPPGIDSPDVELDAEGRPTCCEHGMPKILSCAYCRRNAAPPLTSGTDAEP